MGTSLCDEIFSHAGVMRSWNQTFKIPPVHSTDLIDLRVAPGINPKVPIHVTDQPSFCYPQQWILLYVM